MKSRILTVLILAILFSGCQGKPDQEPTQETAQTEASFHTEATKETTQTPTTEAAEPPTEATEPPTEATYPNYFADHPVSIWQGLDHTVSYDQKIWMIDPEQGNLVYLGLPYAQAHAPYLGGYPSTDTMYALSEDRSVFYSGEFPTKMEVLVSLFPWENFNLETDFGSAAELWTDFMYTAYEKDHAPGITKEAWAEEFQDYHLLACQTERTILCESMLPMALSQEADKIWFNTDKTFVADSNTGTIYYPDMAKKVLRAFPVLHDGHEQNIWIYCDMNYYNGDCTEDPSSAVYKQRATILEQICVLVPVGYQGLLFGKLEQSEPLLTQEEFLEELDSGEESPDWWIGSMYEYLENKEEGSWVNYFGIPNRGA